jgi:CRP-like cAMP-binding protein
MATTHLYQWRLFADLSDDYIQIILAACEERLLVAGEELFLEGDSGDTLWLVKSGRVEIYKNIRGDIDRTLALLGPGEVIGEMGFIDLSLRSAGARTTEISDFLVLSRSAFAQVCAQHPMVAAAFYRNLATILAERVRHTNELYRESVAFAIEATGAACLNLQALSEDLRQVTVYLSGGAVITGFILQLDNSALGYTLILKDSGGKLTIIPYQSIQRIELA